jgi:uncharacterized protein YecT (DUF1311 family)
VSRSWLRLSIAYVRLVQTLEVKQQDELFEEQQSWLGKRAESLRASVALEGGTLKPLEYGGAFEEITEPGLVELCRRSQRQDPETRKRKEKSKP